MPSEKSARSSERKRIINRRVRSSTRTTVAKAVDALKRKESEEAESTVAQAVRALDKAVTKGILHRNNAARRKSRIMAKLNALRVS